MSPTVLKEYVSALDAAADRQRFRKIVDRLSGLADGESTALPSEHGLRDFLSHYCESVAELFAATAVAIWFTHPADGQPRRRVDVGWNNFPLEPTTAAAHERLISYALATPDVLAVQPFSAPLSGATVSNPTDSFLLLAPAAYAERSVAVLEIALGPKPLRRPHDALVRSYLPWLQWLRQILENGMQRCFTADQPLFLALQQLQQTSSEVESMQSQIVLTIQASLQSLAGKKFGSLAANQRVAKEVHALLDSKGLRVKCPECGAAAILRCQNSGNAKTGAFVYDHYLESGRTFHGGPSSFPLLVLTPKPPRRRA